ncbi:aryl hydrocarbon receptor nuclear translocator-like protein 1 isoform X1 [Anopheles merus]|uniref:Cycle n=2 Tax=Anopheles merus TaxID=30066 RepID=A0A182UYY3_ANOME|nr:aryl hydrocarbon receptor nuclear translocator-like protein 1 isoform X1 [Anopheles merus]XP_041771379.1 aryl hydrocarbon receptor nuclear translocator-like protein 1 isoform X1 [Anopheles merus]XP_041771380.1 aryl hydrocarbon receptor nuclear translocator-like protein 1 isoform X1 [Anopheles merus]XP_041771381.1 aryl hydrocarbon receptor nuclear translocator-like protein 1 isoform X1 [Anopheles merus]
MVARNFSLQDLPYNRVLQVPDEEREFLALDELKPHQLTELGVAVTCASSGGGQQQQQQLHQSAPSHRTLAAGGGDGEVPNPVITTGGLLQNYHHHNVFYELGAATNSPSNASAVPTEHMTGGPDASLLVDPSLAGTMSAVSNLSTLSAAGSGNHLLHLADHGHSHHDHQHSSGGARKRKFSFNDTSDIEDDTCDDSKSVRTADESKKQNHSEIEKRRRDKMNTYITELSAMIPMCHAMSRKLDKLTVLRMAVQHLKTIRGAVHSYTEGHYKPAFLSDQELKMLILQAAEGFLFVVGCDRGRILYVSESVSHILNYSQGDLLGQSWFDILHPKDVAKVKEQLSSSDLSPRERLIDAKTMLPVKTDVPQGVTRLCPGARRSFFCRMKCKANVQVKEEADQPNSVSSVNNVCHRRKKQVNSDKKYSVIQCTGYLKSWAPAKIGLEENETDGEGDSCNLSCLVAVGRVQPNLSQSCSLSSNGLHTPSGANGGRLRNGSNAATGPGSGAGGGATGSSSNGNPSATPSNGSNGKQLNRNTIPNLRNVQFISRHAMDGKFLFVDQRATLVLGFLPQELLGTSMYEYYHHEDIPALAESHKAALQGTQCVTTSVYRLRTKETGFVRLQSEWKSFRNPWTKEIEYLIAKNNVILAELGDGGTARAGGYGMGELGDGTGEPGSGAPGQPGVGYEFFNHTNGREIQRMINSHVEASKIGRQIAEQVLDHQRRVGDSSSESSPNPNEPTLQPTFSSALSEANHSNDAITSGEHSMVTSTGVSPSSMAVVPPTVTTRINGTLPGYSHVQTNAIISPEHDVSQTQASSTDGNDEAAMAVIMSLLEADAGLGGPVDFSGLPWPLP